MTLLCFENEQPTAELARATVLQGRRNNEAGGGYCVLKQGFTWTFIRNHDVTVKLMSELIFIKFQYFFNVLADPNSICLTQMIRSTSEL